jgi:hypothetical protein
MVKQRRLDDENVMLLWWKTMLRYDETAMAWWWKRDSNFLYRVIASSWFHSCHRALIIVQSYHLNFAFVPSCIAVHWRETKMYVMCKRNTVIGWYWIVQYRDSFRISTKSRVSLRITFVDARQEIHSRSYTALIVFPL